MSYFDTFYHIKMSPMSYYESIDIDLSSLSGTDLYCDLTAMTEIEKRLEDIPASACHFIDSGNFHYLSLVFLRKLKCKISLVVFDNHTDFKPPAFGGLTSCGSWILEAAKKIPAVERIYLIGTDEKLLNEDKALIDSFNTGERRIYYSGLDEILYAISCDKNSIYISLDKDVLKEQICPCNWSQGKMTLSEIESIIEKINKDHRIIGIDISGGPHEDNEIKNEKNKEVDRKLSDFLTGLKQDPEMLP